MQRESGRNIKRYLAMVCMLTVLLPNGQAEAKDDNRVAVTLPEFSVKLNDMEMDNQYSQYPLLVYNNVTYFPMTYYGSRYLGVETMWSQEEGVGIHQNGVRWNWHGYKRYLPNSKRAVATINTEKIRVNNQLIDSSKEDYPLLSFRDVVYFPLTWRFAVDEFGWTYQYSPQEGLSIHSPGAITASEISLPIREYANGVGAFVKAGEAYYYEGERGIIWQAPVAQPNQAKKVYQLPAKDMAEDDDNGYNRPALQVKHGIVLLTYQQKDGKTCYVKLSADGTAQQLYQGEGRLHCYENLELLYVPNEKTGKGSLQIKGKGSGAFVAVGTTEFYCAKDMFYFDGREIFFLGGLGNTASRKAAETKMMAVDYKTGAVRQISQEDAQFFSKAEGTIYYLNQKNQICQIAENGKAGRNVISTIPATQFVVLQDTICYAEQQSGELRILGSEESSNPGGIVAGMEVQEDFIVVNFADESASAYKTMILSKKGRVLFKTTERTASMIIENGKVSFVKLRN